MDFGYTYNRYYRELFVFAFQLTHCRQKSEDLVHEAFLKFHSFCHQSISNPRAWLYKVILHHYCSNNRNEKRREEILHQMQATEAVEADILETLSANEQEKIVIQALNDLPERERKLLLLYRRGLTYSEIAEILNIKKESVGTTLARTIEKLKNNLKRTHHELFK